MSKSDAQRAMREAKYARDRARAVSQREPSDGGRPSNRPDRPAPGKADRPVTASAEPASVELCGHRSMNGRTCVREASHPEKSHRYG